VTEAFGLGSRWRAAGLGTRLVLFTTVLTAASVLAAFLTISFQIRRNTRELLASTLAHHQRMLLSLEERDLEQLVRTSTVMTDNPTLRAAMETYRLEASPGARERADLLGTVETEAARIAAGLARDLLIVTDHEGQVLASGGRRGFGLSAGTSLGAWPVVRRALAQNAPVGPQNFAVMRFDQRYFQVGCVPIVLQGYIIGTLTVGDLLDRDYVARLHRSFDSQIVVTADGRVLGSTLDAVLPDGSVLGLSAPAGTDAPGPPPVVSIGREDFVAAPLSLGTDQDGRPVTVVLLHSLTAALAPANRSLLWTLLSCGSIAVVLAGVAASAASRSVLRPLQGFVAFMRGVAETGDHSHRFESARAGVEIRVLSETYNHLMESLQGHERRILQRAREDLERVERLKETEKLAALGRMLSGAAHEINNPLTGVVGNIEMLLEVETLSDPVRKRLGTVRSEGRRIVALVRNLLQVAHRDTGERSTVDVNRIVRDTVALRQRDFEKARIGLTLDLAPEPVSLSASDLELQQVFLNIVNNAYDALLDLKPPRTLTIVTRNSPEGATIVFFDDGPGLQDPARVFEHFYTTKPVGKGTGLGLSISHAIVQSHGGTIAADNQPGGGARFTIALPRAAGTGVETAPEARPVIEPPAGRSLPAAVLVVDDEPAVLELQMAILDSVGARAVGARTGAEAVDHLKRQHFDLIVSDLNIPGEMTGKDLYRWAASHRKSGTHGFLFVTGDTVGESVFLEEVRSRCLLKPFSMEEYVTTLREVWRELQNAA
jgi:signal transduction histidine kinase/CheY-like chemotaxis protein